MSKTRENKSSYFIMNKKTFFERELLINASPLYGKKLLQKGAEYSCFYHCLNYIRCRYKEQSELYPQQRNIEKIFSMSRRKLSDLSISHELAKELFNYWMDINKFGIDTILPIELWITFLKLNNKKDIRIVKRWAKEKSQSYSILTHQHFESFTAYLQNEHLGKTYSFNELNEYLNSYFNALETIVIYKILTENLKLDFNKLVIAFLKQRGVNFKSISEINKFVEKQGIRLLEYSQAIYVEQEAQFNNLYFLNKDIVNDLHFLLNTIEKTGPLVFNCLGKILRTIQETYVKRCSNFTIYDLEFKDEPFKGSTHAMLLVGGGIDKKMNEFVYLINPNNSYSNNKKTPIYRISFEKFKTNLLSFENGREDFIHPSGQVYSLSKNFFIYGRYGLNSTRNPVPMELEDQKAMQLK